MSHPAPVAWTSIGHLVPLPAIAADVTFHAPDGTELFMSEVELIEVFQEADHANWLTFTARALGPRSVLLPTPIPPHILEIIFGIPQAPIFHRLAAEKGFAL